MLSDTSAYRKPPTVIIGQKGPFRDYSGFGILPKWSRPAYSPSRSSAPSPRSATAAGSTAGDRPSRCLADDPLHPHQLDEDRRASEGRGSSRLPLWFLRLWLQPEFRIPPAE